MTMQDGLARLISAVYGILVFPGFEPKSMPLIIADYDPGVVKECRCFKLASKDCSEMLERG